MSYDKYFKVYDLEGDSVTAIWGEREGKYCIISYHEESLGGWNSVEYDYLPVTWYCMIPHPEDRIEEISLEETFEIML